MKILVLGGSQFFGRKLVKLLLDNNDDVTILNRGNHADGFGEKIKRIICDRNNKIALEDAINADYDIVFDLSCFDFDQAKHACEVFNGRVKKYLFTSSISAYIDRNDNLSEHQFNPLDFELTNKVSRKEHYGEAKRQAEISFIKFATFPVTSIRLPVILDADDYSQRLQRHVNSIKNGLPLYFDNLQGKISFISADDAAKTLFELGINNFSGTINAASARPITLQRFIEIIEKITDSKIILAKQKSDNNLSPYNNIGDWCLNCSKLQSLGIKLQEIEDYLPEMVKSIHVTL
ncbi:NAD-dependent epimerase/dehydratase family protein [Psychromonas hadalis]|uniref:NAD-dependent epimerase/dehydratase family protein n=1 Tax=Psychromonas hadalis TaxID=211669 RepID=UPI0003B4AB5B|nr:NAD-dependent epimerase/dehydratase family protein [Psychromonas hadalis]